MSQQPERSLEDVLLDIIFKKYPELIKDNDIHSIDFIREFLQDEDKIIFFLESIKNIYSEGEFPLYNLAPILSIISESYNQREGILKNMLYDFTINLLKSTKVNLILLGFDFINENCRLFWDKRKELYSIIIPYWDSNNEKLRAEAIFSLKNYADIDCKYFSSYFKRLKGILIESVNELVIISTTLILGEIYTYNNRNNNELPLKIEEVNLIFSKYKFLKSLMQKQFFLNGLHILLLDYDKYESEWIDFFLNEYTTIKNLDFRFKLLSDIASFPNKKEFKIEDSKKYICFFHNLLQDLLKEDFEKPPPSVLVRPNHLQDVLHNTEQLAFYLPEVMEELLPLYEKVYSKYIPVKVNNGISFERLAHQWIQEIYVILSDYHKTKKSYEKASIYYKKVAEHAFNERQELEFLIKHYQTAIGFEIKDHNFISIKKIFNELNEVFEKYKGKFNETHICYPNWLVFEDLIHICDCSELEYAKNYRTLNEHLINNKEKISEDISLILIEIGIIKGDEFRLKITKNYSECDELRIYIINRITQILEQILEIKSPLVKEIIENVAKSQSRKIIDLAQKRAFQFIIPVLEKKGLVSSISKEVELSEEKLIKILITDLASLQRKNRAIKEEENKYTVFLSELLNRSLAPFNYFTDIQDLSGKTEKKEIENLKLGGMGEIDLRFLNRNLELCHLAEALILNSINTDYIKTHLKKIFDYDANGLSVNFMIIYSKVKDFNSLWQKYSNLVKEYDFKYLLIDKKFVDLSEELTNYAGIKVGLTKHLRDGRICKLYHFFIDFY